ncbi:PREDICTED: transforming growth factor-beta receptor-associated protein 1-like isoform X2 [Priapulus caudatus]|uniref:Transforming growth factor-beta receptor-associated protein 1-like isoform X2 n=1 Tax=Priapulus caudatus TaxID=37621 RepID=A0ABM1DXU3_PRICU|nr:PREDICTED: transforming growth factor-beta receptor-associated protein 1-like isoform X2 [Priapulus caudatus]
MISQNHQRGGRNYKSNNRYIIEYSFDEKMLNGRTGYESHQTKHRFLGQKKPVNQLKAASALYRLLVQFDGSVFMLSMFDLEPVTTASKAKATSFCLNENPDSNNPFSVQMCTASKKKQLHLFTVTEDRIMHDHEIQLPDLPVTMAMDGSHICIALTSQYIVINCDTNRLQDLFPYDSETTMPFVKRVAKEEFLLSGPSALGMFASASGISQRPPVHMIDNLASICYSHPYVLAMNEQFITVHSVIDQQQKQIISFNGGRVLGEFDGRIFVASAREVYGVVPVPWEIQIQSLLADKRITEALDLARNSYKTGLTKDRFNKIYETIQQQAGFIEFSQHRFSEAVELFKSGLVDAREVISLYPLLMPRSSNYTRAVPALHDLADIRQITHGNQQQMSEYKQFLADFLEDIRETRRVLACREEVDTALVKLYAEMDTDKLCKLVQNNCKADLSDCTEVLQQHGRYHALALLHRARGDLNSALALWTRMLDGELEGDPLVNIKYMAKILTSVTDQHLMWKYADWLLKKDEKLGVTMFTCQSVDGAELEPAQAPAVLEFLQRYPEALLKYLEYLVFSLRLEKEKYHTHLALLYMNNVQNLMKTNNTEQGLLEDARRRLQTMLQDSSAYRVHILLGKAQELELSAECAILHGKLEEHEQALEILVHRLRDYAAAEQYCSVNARGRSRSYRHKLFYNLLTAYMSQPADGNTETAKALMEAAISLLNSSKAEFDGAEVLRLIPEDWPISLVRQFLVRTVRRSQHECRMKLVEQALAQGARAGAEVATASVMNRSEIVTEDRCCAVCHKPFRDPQFLRYPNGIVSHIHCSNHRHICPVTGKLFKVILPHPRSGSPTKTTSFQSSVTKPQIRES